MHVQLCVHVWMHVYNLHGYVFLCISFIKVSAYLLHNYIASTVEKKAVYQVQPV